MGPPGKICPGPREFSRRPCSSSSILARGPSVAMFQNHPWLGLKLWIQLFQLSLSPSKAEKSNRSFSSDVTAAILVYQNNEMAAILVYGTGISSFLFKYFVLFHHPTGATDHVSENDLYEREWFFGNR